MKKIILVILLLFGLVNIVYADVVPSVVTVKRGDVGHGLHMINIDWTASNTTAGVSPTLIQGVRGEIIKVVTVGDSIKEPTDNYDVELLEYIGDGTLDVLGTAGLNKNGGATPEQVIPQFHNAVTNDEYYGGVFVMGDLYFTLTNNSVDSASGTVKVYYVDK